MILVRHGQSQFNVVYGKTRQDPGIRDPKLTELGREQAIQAARILRRMGGQTIICSPYRRAIQTATIIAEALGLAIAVDPGVGERAAFIMDRAERGSIVHADEASVWDDLHSKYKTYRINHSIAYKDEDACTNQAESYFSRLRRAEIGTHYHIAGPYLSANVNEMAWREDNRRVPNGTQYTMVIAAAMAHPVSREWKGYWQRAA